MLIPPARGRCRCGPTPSPTSTRPCPHGDSSRPSLGPQKQRESRRSPGPDSLCCAETRPKKGVQRKAREEKVETRPRPQEVTVGEGRASFPRKRGQMRNALGFRATSARELPRVPASARLSCSLPQRPAVPGPLSAWHPHLGYSQSPGLPVVFHHGGCDGAIPGQGGGQGWGGEGVGRKGRGLRAPAGDRGKGTEPCTRGLCPQPAPDTALQPGAGGGGG